VEANLRGPSALAFLAVRMTDMLCTSNNDCLGVSRRTLVYSVFDMLRKAKDPGLGLLGRSCLLGTHFLTTTVMLLGGVAWKVLWP